MLAIAVSSPTCKARPIHVNLKYTNHFYDQHDAGSIGSAQAVVPIVLELLSPRSVVDVGCGRGAWLKIFRSIGLTDVRGLDGDYVDRDRLLIPREIFGVVDLAHPPVVHEKYDLALCLEVGEHLPHENSSALINFLSHLAPAVLFSAAIPGQGGHQHVNEQWPLYWRKLFAERGFVMLDPIRPRIRDDVRVQWWYRQNLFLLISENRLSSYPQLTDARKPPEGFETEWIHADLLTRHNRKRFDLRTGSQLPLQLLRLIRCRSKSPLR